MEYKEADGLPFLDELSPLPGQVCPFIPAQESHVEELFQILNVKPTDVLLDMGCGDGRIVVHAASRHSIRGVGIDINEGLLEESRELAKKQKVEHLCAFKNESFGGPGFSFDTVCGAAGRPSIITSYLIPEASAVFRTKLVDYMRRMKAEGYPVRVVSIAFKLYDWRPVTTAAGHNLYLYDATSLPDN